MRTKGGGGDGGGGEECSQESIRHRGRLSVVPLAAGCRPPTTSWQTCIRPTQEEQPPRSFVARAIANAQAAALAEGDEVL